MASIDGVVGIALFVLFVAWSFIYLSSVFSAERGDAMEEASRTISGRIAAYLTVDAYEIPVSYTSQSNASGVVFYFDHAWPSAGARNSTRVYGSINALPCNITGNRLYWQSDVTEGANSFIVRYSNKDVAMNCTGGFPIMIGNKTIPWSAVKKQLLSQDRINGMAAMDYPAFKMSLGIERDFRVELNASGSVTEYGSLVPNGTDVHVKTTRHGMEDNRKAEMRVLTW